MLKHNLLVLGSQNAKEADQKLKREEIRPVQILKIDGTVESLNFFNDWGKVGVSSIAWRNDQPDELFVSINDEIRRLNVQTREFEVLPIPDVADIHDIHFIDGLLWISNTEYDEAVAFDVDQNTVKERISLDPFRKVLDDMDENASDYEKVKDRFHCNQVFKNYEGDLCVLIHCISGWQFYRVLFEMLVKQQGDGGVINVDREKVVQLRLQSPHTVRMINNKYWVQDSSDLSCKIFDRDWEPVGEIELGGFGRGADFSLEEDIIYIGLSATRKRYLKIIPTSNYHSNRVWVGSISDQKKKDEIAIPNIEQMDNVYILSPELLQIFEKFKKGSEPTGA